MPPGGRCSTVGREPALECPDRRTQPPNCPAEKMGERALPRCPSTQFLVGFAREIRRHCGASGGAERRLPVQRDWLAVDAVSSEPVSGLNSLVTGRFTGNFAPREPSCADQTVRKCLPIGLFSAFGSCSVENRAGNFRTG